MSNTHLGRIPSESIHLTVTSPPYVTTEFRAGQEFDYDGFLRGFSAVCADLYRVTVPGGRFALNVADMLTKYRFPEENVFARVPFGMDCLQVAVSQGFRLFERFIWDKGYTRTLGGPVLGSYPYPLSLFNNNYFEYIFVFRKPGRRVVRQDVRNRSRLTLGEWRRWVQNWWRIESVSHKVPNHTAVFPIEVPYRLIRMYSYIGDTVLDPYMGTGATMIASHQADRSSVGFEIADNCKEMVDARIRMEMGTLFESKLEYSFVKE